MIESKNTAKRILLQVFFLFFWFFVWCDRGGGTEIYKLLFPSVSVLTVATLSYELYNFINKNKSQSTDNK